MFKDLMWEMQGQILSYCSLDDIKSLSLASSEYNKIVKPILFRHIRLLISKLTSVHDVGSLENFRYVKSLKLFEALSWKFDKLKKHGLEALQNFHQLEELQLSKVKASLAEEILYLPNKKALRKLEIYGLYSKDFSTEHKIMYTMSCHYIANLLSLEEICLNHMNVGDIGISHFLSLRKLKKLNLSYAGIKDGGCEDIAKCVGLEGLSLRGNGVTDVGICLLVSLNKLKQLDLSMTNITDNSCETISKFISLEELHLIEADITDSGFSHLVSLKKLKQLDISKTEITKDSWENIVKLVSLEKLVLFITRVTDNTIPYLLSLTRLRKLVLPGAYVRIDYLEHISKLLPLLEVVPVHHLQGQI